MKQSSNVVALCPISRQNNKEHILPPKWSLATVVYVAWELRRSPVSVVWYFNTQESWDPGDK